MVRFCSYIRNKYIIVVGRVLSLLRNSVRKTVSHTVPFCSVSRSVLPLTCKMFKMFRNGFLLSRNMDRFRQFDAIYFLSAVSHGKRSSHHGQDTTNSGYSWKRIQEFRCKIHGSCVAEPKRTNDCAVFQVSNLIPFTTLLIHPPTVWLIFEPVSTRLKLVF